MKLIGSVRLRPCFVALFLAIAFQGWPAAVAASDAGPEELDRQIPFALAVRGGVSLGSYEAGFNWALLQYMKTLRIDNRTGADSYIELKATSGASAGSINALISTLSWCIDDNKMRAGDLFPDRVSENILYDTWLNMGFEELLPKEVDSLDYYRADDGVLTRNAFKNAIGRMENLLSTDGFRPGCEVRFGIMVTRVDPAVTNIAGVRVHNQRFVIPLTFLADESGHARFLGCLVDDNDPAFGNVMYLQGKRTGKANCPIEHDTSAVINAIEASSAFPVAFGRKHISECESVSEDMESVVEEVGRCPVGMRHAVDEFIDGGLFDNIPLGVAKALAEPGQWDSVSGPSWERSGRRFNYVYLDPTIRRSVRQSDGRVDFKVVPTAEEEETEADETTYGLRSQLRFLGGAVASSRDYELYNLLRGGDWTNQVFTHADNLAEAIQEQYPGIQRQDPVLENLHVILPECDALLDRDWGNGPSPKPDIISEANECIVVRAYLLELEYKGTPFDGQLKSSNEVTRQRNILIDWIVRLAAYVGEDRLAMAASRAKNDKLGDRRILLSSRFSPVIGEMMQAFGAFVDRSFREYDYYAGIYDAVWGTANFVCERQFSQRACLAEQIHRIHLALGIPESLAANTVFLHLLRLEFADGGALGREFAWANSYDDQGTDHNMLAIARSLFAHSDETGENLYAAPTMTEFITGLIDEQYDASNSSAFLQRIFKLKDKDELTWYYPLTLRASNRLLILERKEGKVMGGGDIYAAGLTLGAVYLHSYMQEEDLTLNVSTAPDYSWQSWLPDEIAVDARHGGVDLSWYQGHRIGKKGWRWDVKLTPIQLNHSGASRDDYVWFSQADFLISWKKHGAFSAIGMGPSISYSWKEWPDTRQVNIGAAMYMGFLEDKFRITIGAMSFDSGFAGGNYYVNLGVNDVPGFVYWGMPRARGSWWHSKSEW